MSTPTESHAYETKQQVRRVVSNSALTTLALFIVRAFNTICFFLITWYLGELDAGIYALALNYALLFSQLALWGLDQLLTREIAHQPADIRSIIGYFLLVRVLATTICYGLLIFVVVGVQRYTGLVRDCLLIGGTMVFAESLTRFCQTIFSAHERSHYSVTTSIIGGVLKVAGIGLIILIGRFTVLAFVTMIAVTSLISLCAGMGFFFTAFHRPTIEHAWALTKRYAGPALPFIIISTASTIEFQADTLFLSRLIKQNVEVKVGAYNAITVVLYTLLMLTQGVRSALLPGMSKAYLRNRDLLTKFFEKSFKLLVIATLPVCLLISWFAGDIARLLYGQKFGEAAGGLQIVIWSFLFLTSMIPATTVMVVLDKRRFLIFIQIGVTLVNALGNLLLVPRFEIQGAVWARLASSLSAWLLNLWLVRKSIDVPFRAAIAAKIALGLGLTIACLLLFRQIHLQWMLAGILAAAVYAAFMLAAHVVNKRELSMFRPARSVEAAYEAYESS